MLTPKADKKRGWLSSLTDLSLDLDRTISGFCLTMWAVVVLAVAAIVSKAVIGKPSGTPLHYLLIVIIVASSLAVLAASGIISRIRKLGFKGFEMELSADVRIADAMLPYEEYPPTNMEVFGEGARPADFPFPIKMLSGPQKYQYERLSYHLYQLFNVIRDTNELDVKNRENCRSLIKRVGRAAHVMGHYTKARDIFKNLELFKDRDLSAYELRLLGTAHIWAGYETMGDMQKENWENSVGFLLTAKEKNPYDEHTLFNLGWVLLSLGKYEAAIEYLGACMKQNKAVTPWAKWNIACAEVNLGNKSGASQVLEEIPKGPWWGYIAKDEDFSPLRNDAAFRDRFEALCKERQTPAGTKSVPQKT